MKRVGKKELSRVQGISRGDLRDGGCWKMIEGDYECRMTANFKIHTADCEWVRRSRVLCIM